jgi:peptidyl-prolyl cis-trans isomerase D
MFDAVRNHKRWTMLILLVLILPSFVFFGIEGYSQFFTGERALAVVGSEKIRRQDFDEAQRQQIDRMRQMFGGQLDASLVDSAQMRREVLDRLIDQRVLAQEARSLWFTASDERLREAILAIPSVLENGQFSRERYDRLLRSNGLTVEGFEARLRSDLAIEQVIGPVQSTTFMPAELTRKLIAIETEQRDVRTVSFPEERYRAGIVITEDEIRQRYESTPTRFEIPEKADAEYVVLDEAAAAKGVTVSDADIQSFYEQNKARFSTPEQRRASHILIELPGGSDAAAAEAVRARAQAILERVKANPANFAAIARAESQDPGSAARGGDLGWFGRGMMVAPFEQAVFGLHKGQLSDLVQTEFGFHIIKLTDIRVETVRPLTEVRTEIEREVRAQLAARRFAEMSNEFDNLVYEQSDSLEPVAQRFGLTIRRAEGLVRQAPSRQAGPDTPIADNPRFREALFSDEVLREQRNSGVFEVSPSVRVAVRATRVIPASKQALEAVTEQLRTELTREKAAAAALAAAREQMEALKAGRNPSLDWSKVQAISRTSGRYIPPEILDPVLRVSTASLPAYTVIELDGQGAILVEVQAVRPGNTEVSAEQLRQMRSVLAQQYARAESRALLAHLRESRKVKVNHSGEQLIERGASPTSP